jgi:predicted dehydrogenase
MRIAIFDVSHWHFPLYLDALRDPGITVVGVSDAENFAGQLVARDFGCPLFPSSNALLESAFDFALVFSRHSEMAGLAERLIARGKPFLIEKPCGVAREQVARLRRAADQAGVFVAVRFIFRVSELLALIREANPGPGAAYEHLAFRFIAGPIGRYERVGCGWMLDRVVAGGGCAINLAVHFIDMVAALTQQPVAEVSARTRRFRPDVTVEEQAAFVVSTASGQIGTVETGYLYPSTADDQRDFSFSLSHGASYIEGHGDALTVKRKDDLSRRTVPVEFNTDRYYPVFLRRALDDLRRGRAPIVGLREAEHVLAVIEAGYRSAERGGEPEAVAAPS